MHGRVDVFERTPWPTERSTTWTTRDDERLERSSWTGAGGRREHQPLRGAKLVRFVPPEKVCGFLPGLDEDLLAALYGLDVETDRELSGRFDANARRGTGPPRRRRRPPRPASGRCRRPPGPRVGRGRGRPGSGRGAGAPGVRGVGRHPSLAGRPANDRGRARRAADCRTVREEEPLGGAAVPFARQPGTRDRRGSGTGAVYVSTNSSRGPPVESSRSRVIRICPRPEALRSGVRSLPGPRRGG